MSKAPETARSGPSCWILTDGKIGMENQCLGLAEAAELNPVIKRITPRFPWSVLPPQLWFTPLAAPGPAGDMLTPPWPDLLIATGRQTVAPAIAIGRAAAGRTKIVQIQNPRVAPGKFDLVIAPAHDRLSGPNVLETTGALHRVNAAALSSGAEEFAERYDALPRPRIAVLIGGSNASYRMTADAARRLGKMLADAAAESGAGLMITASRRTGTENLQAIRDALAHTPADIWDMSGANPYFGMLALADAIMATNDSVNMVSEAAATGKPVHIFALEGKSAKFDRFHAEMERRGITRPFTGRFESWDYAPPDDMTRAADAVRRLIGAD